ncbi:MAG: 50S ribosomal protein L28 [Oligoflexales bacterium]|nr:50S ribosomal protein L28 [Oligoflexales bacterium]
MSRICDLSGKRVQVGNRISHSNIKTKHRFKPNLHKRRCWSGELKGFVKLNLSNAALRTLDKVGLDQYARRMGLDLRKFLCTELSSSEPK